MPYPIFYNCILNYPFFILSILHIPVKLLISLDKINTVYYNNHSK
jgi:hypothetical protein